MFKNIPIRNIMRLQGGCGDDTKEYERRKGIDC